MANDYTDSSFSQFPNSYWLKHPVPHFPSLQDDVTTEFAVVGGGIVGIITAYLLAKEGKDVTLVEARDLLTGVTGNTTAKLTAQHSLIYDELISTFNEDKARLYYDANMDGLRFVRQTAEQLGIGCDLDERDAIVFSTTEKGKKQIEKESRAYAELGIDGFLTLGQVRELPFSTTAALTMTGQAQFHPVKFLAGLVEETIRLGGKIYEQTRVVSQLKKKTGLLTEHGSVIDCKKIVVATHYPFNDFNGLYFSKLTIKRSYGLLADVGGPIPEGMYINAESPSRSLRSVENDDGETLLLIGGEGHQTGKSSVPNQEHYTNLESYGKDHFDLKTVRNHWSAQDMTTLDKVPYVGQMSLLSGNTYVATGFNKWGMAMGATAAKVLTDQLLDRPNAYSGLLNPLRSKLKLKDAGQFAKKNVSVSKDFVWTKAKRPHKTPDQLRPDEGGFVSVDGKKVGGYRDKDGTVHLVKTTCTHMGCGLDWNDGERSWDCPCHGSRFSYEGEVLEGPAVKPLKKME